MVKREKMVVSLNFFRGGMKKQEAQMQLPNPLLNARDSHVTEKTAMSAQELLGTISALENKLEKRKWLISIPFFGGLIGGTAMALHTGGSSLVDIGEALAVAEGGVVVWAGLMQKFYAPLQKELNRLRGKQAVQKLTEPSYSENGG